MEKNPFRLKKYQKRQEALSPSLKSISIFFQLKLSHLFLSIQFEYKLFGLANVKFLRSTIFLYKN